MKGKMKARVRKRIQGNTAFGAGEIRIRIGLGNEVAASAAASLVADRPRQVLLRILASRVKVTVNYGFVGKT